MSKSDEAVNQHILFIKPVGFPVSNLSKLISNSSLTSRKVHSLAVSLGEVKSLNKDSTSIMAAMEVLREEYGEKHFATIFKTITADNFSEFEQLAKLEAWRTDVYYSHPYSSWERPQNERLN